MLGSFDEADRSDPHPDHCAVSARFRVAPAFVTVPFFVAASGTPLYGFVRIENHSDESGTVEISAIDDSGEPYGPTSLAIDAGDVASFTSRDLEEGSVERGLSAGVGDGDGHWRVQLGSDLDMAAQAYARNPKDYVSRIDVTVPGVYEEGMHRHTVAFFNPGSNLVKRAVLRLVNPGDGDAEVTISAVDDDGVAAPEGDVTLAPPAGQARDLSTLVL